MPNERTSSDGVVIDDDLNPNRPNDREREKEGGQAGSDLIVLYECQQRTAHPLNLRPRGEEERNGSGEPHQMPICLRLYEFDR